METKEYRTKGGFNLRLEARLKNAELVRARESLGLSAKQVAEELGISYGVFLHYESLRMYPSEETQNKICEFYRQKGYFMLDEDVFPEEIRYLKTKKMIAEKEIPKEKLVSLSYIDRKLLPVYEPAQAEDLDRKSIIENILNTLPIREKEVLELRFGLNGNKPLTLKEAGKVMGVSRERIRQIEARALRNSRHPSRSRKLREFV